MTAIVIAMGSSHHWMVTITGAHGTRPVAGIAYRDPDGRYTVWDVRRATTGPIAKSVTRQQAQSLLREIGEAAEKAIATALKPKPAPLHQRRGDNLPNARR